MKDVEVTAGGEEEAAAAAFEEDVDNPDGEEVEEELELVAEGSRAKETGSPSGRLASPTRESRSGGVGMMAAATMDSRGGVGRMAAATMEPGGEC